MEIKTKYNIDDEVWWMKDSKALSGEIVSIHFHQWSDRSITKEYTVERYDISETHKVCEKYLFPPKKNS